MNTAQTVAAIQGMQADFGGRLSAIVGVVQKAQADAAAAQAQAAASAAILARGGNMIASDFTDLPSYDVGTPNVQGDQVAQIHDSEIVVDAQSANVLRNYGIRIQTNTQQTTQNNSELVALLKENSQKQDMIIQLLNQMLAENTDQTDLLALLKEIMGDKLPRSLQQLRSAKSPK